MSLIYKFYNFRQLFNDLSYNMSANLTTRSIIGKWVYDNEYYIIKSNGTIERTSISGTFSGTYEKINENNIISKIELPYNSGIRTDNIFFDMESDRIFLNSDNRYPYYRDSTYSLPSPNTVILFNQNNSNILIESPKSVNIRENFRNNYKTSNISIKFRRPSDINKIPVFNINIGGINIHLFGTLSDSNIDNNPYYRFFDRDDEQKNIDVNGNLFTLESFFQNFSSPYITILLSFSNSDFFAENFFGLRAYAYDDSNSKIEIPIKNPISQTYGIAVPSGNISISLLNRSSNVILNDIKWSIFYLD